jgi:hypothetical protein
VTTALVIADETERAGRKAALTRARSKAAFVWRQI